MQHNRSGTGLLTPTHHYRSKMIISGDTFGVFFSVSGYDEPGMTMTTLQTCST